jgi:hypothetical protein
MNPSDFSQDILAKIEEQHLEPRPRWQFFVVRSLWWLMAIITTTLGGIAFATVLFFLREHEWGWVIRQSGAFGVLRAIPLLWLLIFALFALLTVYDVRATRRGYRYQTGVIVGVIVLASGVLGGVVYASGFEAYSHDFLQARVATYRALAPDPALLWQAPQQGRFIGVVSATSSEGFVLRDQVGDARAILLTSSSRWLVPQPANVGLPLKVVCESTAASTTWNLLEARPLRARAPVLAPQAQPPVPVRPLPPRLERRREKREDRREQRNIEREDEMKEDSREERSSR